MTSCRQLEEVYSWRLMTEIWRRFPDRFRLAETHPGGGQYDCLSLIDLRPETKSSLDINRGGSLHVHHGDAPQSWPDWIQRSQTDTVGFLNEVCRSLGMASPKSLPSSTPTTITYRFISEFLTHAIGRLETWECRSGFCDTSGYGGGPRKEWFDVFPSIRAAPPPSAMVKTRLPAECGYWFLVKDSQPQLCLDTDGRAFKKSGDVVELPAIYARHKRIWTLIAETAIELLP